MTSAVDTSSEPLPPLYDRWIRSLLGGNIPRESRATCDHCAMLPDSSEATNSSRHFFQPSTKCCTYVPDLANFLVGGTLSDTDPQAEFGKRSLLKRMAEGIAITPLGVGQSPLFSLVYNHAEDAFGVARGLRCPHYLESEEKCGVWRQRNATCSTWFCKHVRGNTGYQFWRKSLHPLLGEVERQLAWWCVLRFDLPQDQLRLLYEQKHQEQNYSVNNEAIDNQVDPKIYARLWGDWLGREGEFFIRCGEWVNGLDWSDVSQICGSQVRALAQLTVNAYKELTSDEVPAKLQIGAMELVQISRDCARVSTYSRYDPIDMPYYIIELLSYFEANSTEEALQQIEAEKGIRLDQPLVRKLVDFGLLKRAG